MCPRPYRLGLRQKAGKATRARVLHAARKTLLRPEGPGGFSIDAVAHEAGVSRMTVYYRFESKRGLLEALFDDIAARGRIDRLPEAFRQSDPLVALASFLRVFTGFWASSRLLLRRLHGMAVMDAELDQALRHRSERRRHGLRVLVHRIAELQGLPGPPEDVVDVLYTLTSFETFDSLARGKRGAEETGELVWRLALAALGKEPG
jgi:AcrR family transcriptional regulator